MSRRRIYKRGLQLGLSFAVSTVTAAAIAWMVVAPPEAGPDGMLLPLAVLFAGLAGLGGVLPAAAIALCQRGSSRERVKLVTGAAGALLGLGVGGAAAALTGADLRAMIAGGAIGGLVTGRRVGLSVYRRLLGWDSAYPQAQQTPQPQAQQPVDDGRARAMT